jgi:hypothetical protein
MTMPEEQEQQQQEQQVDQQQQQQQDAKAGKQQQQAKSSTVDAQIKALMDEVTTLRTWKIQRESDEARRADEARLEDQRRLAESGKIKELVEQHAAERASERKRAAEAESRFKNSERSRELALALSSHKLVKGAAEQLSRLWADEFDVIESGDGFQVRSKDLKAPRDWVAERLAMEEYAHFVQAESRGSKGGAQGQAAAPTPGGGGQQQRRTLAEDLVERLKQQQQQVAGYLPARGLHRVG